MIVLSVMLVPLLVAHCSQRSRDPGRISAMIMMIISI